MKNLLKLQLVRYVLVGGLNTTFSYIVYATLLYLGLSYAASNFGALLLGIVFSFRTQGRLVFGNRESRLIFRFGACWGVIWLFNIAIISLLMHTGINAYWAGALALLPSTLISYFAQRVFVFGRRQSANTTNSSF